MKNYRFAIQFGSVNFMLVCLVLCFLGAGTGYTFEIKPRSIDGSDKDWMQKLKYRKVKKDCDSVIYKASHSEPVHEYITASQMESFCNQLKESKDNTTAIFKMECKDFKKNISANDPLLSGVEFNDDPFGIMKQNAKTHTIKGILENRYTMSFSSVMENDKNHNLTNQSHNGSLQYLHSMCADEDDCNKTKEDVINYISAAFLLAKKIDFHIQNSQFNQLTELEELPMVATDTDVKYGFEDELRKLQGTESECEIGPLKNKFPLAPRGHSNIGNIFLRCPQSLDKHYGEYSKDDFVSLNNPHKKTYNPNEQIITRARFTALLALGSALHVIQDSYSQSHTHRDDKHQISQYYHYPNCKHCLSDQYAKGNEKPIENAQTSTKEFLELYLNSACNPNNWQVCKAEVQNWLKNNIFMEKMKAPNVALSK